MNGLVAQPAWLDRPRPAVMSRDAVRLHHVIEWTLYGFAFSIPLEYPDRTSPLEVHTITGFLLVTVALLQPRITLRRPPTAFWWMAAYLWVYGMATLFAVHSGEALWSMSQLALAAGVFWISANLLRNGFVARNTLLSFLAGCLLVAGLNAAGIATKNVGEADEVRQVVFGQNANLLGVNMALALVCVAGLTIGRERPVLTTTWAGAASLVLGYSLLLTGSRAAVAALAGGLIALAARAANVKVFAKTLGVVVLAGLAVSAAVVSSESMRHRYGKTFEGGSLSGREKIYPIAWEMVREHPVFGWGPIDNNYELGGRTATFHIGALAGAEIPSPTKDFHNLFLDTLTATGAAGLVPLLICLVLCIRNGWRARSSPEGTLPLALTVTVLLAAMSANWSASKQTWLIVGYAAASASVATSRRIPRREI